ncbi:MAG TPA: polyphosphate:AMP phosphotransferase [Rhodocyclaceae bacterium]|jgi:polyphosphate:AMP phosphotransferase|nr:polyphosphate:AMP phosphotransferase [Rhodocyclaceae bacterium]
MGLFDAAERGQTVNDAIYEKRVKILRSDLLDAQYDLKEAGDFSVLVLVNGLDGAGKGETVNLLNAWMDPRHIQTHAFPPPNEQEQERPPMWRFWKALPPKGRIGILFGNWYSDPVVTHANSKSKQRHTKLDARIADILRFEKMLADEGVLLIKYWFHLSKEGQEKRLQKLEANPRTAWRVTKHDWKLYKHYDDYVATAEKVLVDTSRGHAPWTLIDGSDENWRSLAVGEHLLEQIKKRLATRRPTKNKSVAKSEKVPKSAEKPGGLATLDMSASLGDKKYARELEKWQGELNLLSRHPKFRERSSVLVFEGMDAAGKGGTIRRVTAALDARHYYTIPIAAPSEEERAQPYLWRFWRCIPGHGQFAVFDRSWYGRVLVERVEGFCSEADWQRAYGEINDFERQLIDHGAIVSKFWLSVSPNEQLQRFHEREHTRFKRFKITPDDWRNRARWPLYEAAVNDMIELTGTAQAPWKLIAADDKQYARVEVLKTLCQRIEEAL